MCVRSQFVIPACIIVANVGLALSLVASPSTSSVATAAEEVPAIGQVAVEDLNEQTQGDKTQFRPAQPQMMNEDGDFWDGWWIVMPQFTGDRASGHSPLYIAKER